MSRITILVRAVATSMRRLPAVLAATVLLMTGLGGNSTSIAQAQEVRPPLGTEQLDQLVAPIALYPDNLLAQVLAASSYPLEVVMAARWAAANPNLTGQQLEDAMQRQNWEPSVKAITAVPQVLAMMSDKLEWTRELGDAHLSQPDDIAAAVQRLRARADASGNLRDTTKIKVRRAAAPPPEVVVVDPLPEYIFIEPYEPDILYVPIYDPWVVYGVWPYPDYGPFYWYPPGYVTVGIIGFGAPCLVGAAIWANYNWYSRRVVVNVVKYNKFNRASLANTAANQSWKYNAARANLSPNNPGQKQFKPYQGSKTGPGGNQNFLSSKSATGNQSGVARLNANQNLKNAGKNFNVQKNVNTNNPNLAPGHYQRNVNLNKNANINSNPLSRNANINNNPNLNRNAGTNKNLSGHRQLNQNQNMRLNQNVNVRPSTGVKPTANAYQKKKQ